MVIRSQIIKFLSVCVGMVFFLAIGFAQGIPPVPMICDSSTLLTGSLLNQANNYSFSCTNNDPVVVVNQPVITVLSNTPSFVTISPLTVSCPPFHPDNTVHPGESCTYSGSLTPSQVGNYNFTFRISYLGTTYLSAFTSVPTLSVIKMTSYALPIHTTGPYGITTGSDGNLWFTESLAVQNPPPSGPWTNYVSTMTPIGTVTRYPLPNGTYPQTPHGITSGPGANSDLWFTESGNDHIAHMTTAGSVTEIPIASGSQPEGITVGPDNNMWFTQPGTHNIGTMTTAGTGYTQYSIVPGIPGTPAPRSIISGPDGNLWFTDQGTNSIGKMNTSGTLIAEYPIQTASSDPSGIAVGSDGNLWFTESSGNNIGRITTAGVITEYPIPTANSNTDEITAGPDGALWFTESDPTFGNKIGRITTAHVFAEYPGLPQTLPQGITTGSDGNLWFASSGLIATPDHLGVITPP